MHVWMADSLRRFFPASPAKQCDTLALDAARGERVSFQVVCRTDARAETVTATATADGTVDVRIRRVGYVPMPHFNTDVPQDELDGAEFLPGFVPDPLLPETTVQAGPFETHAFWISLHIPSETTPGTYAIAVTLTAGEEATTCTATLRVHPIELPTRRDFPVTHWFYADALLDWYGLSGITDEAFWTILEAYFANLTAHGQDMVYVPVFTPPLDGVKRPTQLLNVRREGDRYHFDWSLVRRWIQTAQAQGVSRFEWTHLFTQWGVKHALRIYEGHGENGSSLWPPETGATSPTYRNFLGQFLPELERFLHEERVMERSVFHLSDEPHGDECRANYRAARELLRELAPWMPVMDALSDIEFAREGLIETPIPIIDEFMNFVQEGFPAWAYFCCAPRGRYLNRFLDTPLAKIRMSGWVFYRTGARGFLHWGYNYWYKCGTQQLIDPFMVTDALAWPGWSYGDPFVVYPGTDGPIDSLRWEVFAESLQDYALLQAAGITPDDPLLAEITDYADFPRDPNWVASRRAHIFSTYFTKKNTMASTT